jgi:hypothetical protein
MIVCAGPSMAASAVVGQTENVSQLPEGLAAEVRDSAGNWLSAPEIDATRRRRAGSVRSATDSRSTPVAYATTPGHMVPASPAGDPVQSIATSRDRAALNSDACAACIPAERPEE